MPHIVVMDRPRRVADVPGNRWAGSAGMVYWYAHAWETEADYLAGAPPELEEDGVITVYRTRAFVKDARGRLHRLSDDALVDHASLGEIADPDLYETRELTPREVILNKIRAGVLSSWNQGIRGNNTHRPGPRGPLRQNGRPHGRRTPLPPDRAIPVDDRPDRFGVVHLPEVQSLSGHRFDAVAQPIRTGLEGRP